MSFIDAALIVGGAGLLGGVLSGAGASKAGGQAADAANRATDQQLQMFKTINDQQAPYRQAGYTALSDIANLQPQFTHQFNAGDLNANLAPNYQFQLEQGLGAVKNASNLQTGFSGNTLKGINDYAQNFAGNAYQNAFANYSANQTNIFNRLSNIAGLGQTANANVGNAGATISGGAAQSQIAGGAAQAAGTVGLTQGLGGGLQNAGSWYGLSQIMNQGGGGAGSGAFSNPDYMAYLNASG